MDLKTSAGTELAVSVFYPESIPQEITFNYRNAESNALTPGNTVRDMDLPPTAKPLPFTYFLTGVDVQDGAARGTIVVLGDSMTDGGAPCWPALLAQRLRDAGKDYGVLNAAIGGNRLLHDSQMPSYRGESALGRFDRDVLSQPGVRYVILYEGINDIAVGGLNGFNPNPATTSAVTGAILSLAQRAHNHRLKLFVVTLGAIEGRPADYYSPKARSPLRTRLRPFGGFWI